MRTYPPIINSIPVSLIDRTNGHIRGIEVTDGLEQIDICDCCRLAWGAFSLAYCEGADIFECPLTTNTGIIEWLATHG